MRSSSAASVCAATSALTPRARSRTDTSPSTLAAETVASLPLSPGAEPRGQPLLDSASDTPAVRSVRIATAAPRPARARAKSVSSAVVAAVSPPRGSTTQAAGLRIERPAGLAVGGGPHGGALGQQRQPLVAARQRSVAPAVQVLERGEHLLVEDQARAGGAGQDAAGDVGGTRDDDRERRGRRQRPLQRDLVLVHDRAALQTHAGGGRARVTTVAASSSIGAVGAPSTTSRTPGVRAIPAAGRRAAGPARRARRSRRRSSRRRRRPGAARPRRETASPRRRSGTGRSRPRARAG